MKWIAIKMNQQINKFRVWKIKYGNKILKIYKKQKNYMKWNKNYRI